MSDTPKTDKLAKREFVPDGVWIRHARELERENAALRADAERYRYIKKSETMEVSEILQSFCVSITFDLDAAIDAARKEDQP